MRYEVQYLDGDGALFNTVTCESAARLGETLGQAIDCLRIACVEDDGTRRALTPAERAAMVAAMEQHGLVIHEISGRPGWLAIPWPEDPWVDDQDDNP